MPLEKNSSHMKSSHKSRKNVKWHIWKKYIIQTIWENLYLVKKLPPDVLYKIYWEKILPSYEIFSLNIKNQRFAQNSFRSKLRVFDWYNRKKYMFHSSHTNIYKVKGASPVVFYEMLLLKFYHHLDFFAEIEKPERTVQNLSVVQNQTLSSYRIELLLGDWWNGVHIHSHFSVKTKATDFKLCTQVGHNYMPSFKLVRPGNWPEGSCLAPSPSHSAPL